MHRVHILPDQDSYSGIKSFNSLKHCFVKTHKDISPFSLQLTWDSFYLGYHVEKH